MKKAIMKFIWDKARSTHACPLCGRETIKVIYYGLPHRLCENEQCHYLFGLCSHLTQVLPFNGFFLEYTGSYFRALIVWLSPRPLD